MKKITLKLFLIPIFFSFLLLVSCKNKAEIQKEYNLKVEEFMSKFDDSKSFSEILLAKKLITEINEILKQNKDVVKSAKLVEVKKKIQSKIIASEELYSQIPDDSLLVRIKFYKEIIESIK